MNGKGSGRLLQGKLNGKGFGPGQGAKWFSYSVGSVCLLRQSKCIHCATIPT